MRIFTWPNEKPLILKKREGTFFLLLMPGMLLGAIIVLLPTVFGSIPYKEGTLVSIPEEWWLTFRIGLRLFMLAGVSYFGWALWFFTSRLVKDGYIDALWEHSQKLKLKRDALQAVEPFRSPDGGIDLIKADQAGVSAETLMQLFDTEQEE